MNRLRNRVIFSLASVVAATLSLVSLTGCAGFGAASFPDASANPAQIPIGTIQGSNFGGHAPLVGAHIYLVEPSTTAYGGVVKGLLSATSANPSFPTTKNGNWTSPAPTTSDNFVPATDSAGNPFYGVTTDATGNFQISGDYTCDAGSPVYLIGYGGSPSYPSTVNTFNVSSITVAGSGTAHTFTFTISNGPENAYIGESATISGTLTGVGTYTAAGGGVQATSLTTTTFQLNSTTGTNGTNVAQTGVTVTFSPTFNPSAVNMAVLGNCPSTGVANFGSTSTNPIKYVYMNEVSTTATAYAFAGFVSSTATSQTGLDEFHVGSSGTTQAKLGIQNAALTAGNLYDITGSNISTSYAGEGHIARTTTVGSNSTTTATVPQALIDTIGNILAACVDSNNTLVITGTTGTSPVTDTTSGVQSAQCQTLFQHATDNGVLDTTTYNATLPATGHQPYNIAQAAFNMANFPQGNGTGTTNSSGVQALTAQTPALAATWVSDIFAIPTGNVPFTPNNTSTGAATLDSFVIPITYTNATMLTPYRNAVDSQGNIWVVGGAPTANTAAYALKFSPLGVQLVSTTGVDNGTSIAIDGSDNAWVTSSGGTAPGSVQKISSTGTVTQLAPTGIDLPYAIAIDSTGAPWVGNENGTSVLKLTSAGAVTTTITNADFNAVEGAAIDSSNNAWFADVTGGSVQEVLSGGTTVNKNITTPSGATRIQIDASNNVWVASSTAPAKLYGFNNAGTALTGSPFTVTTATLTNPEGLGIDGTGKIWMANAGSATTSTLTEFTNAGAYLANLNFPGQNNTRGAQVDPSGNIWLIENALTTNNLIELVGAAAPVVTPISPLKLGVRP